MFMITAINTLFWVFLHFGVAFIFVRIPEKYRLRIYNNKSFFTVSQREIRFYKKIGLPKWKDRLPQYNKGFNKRNLSNEISKEYLESFIIATYQAETVHYIIIPLGYLSVFFALLTSNRDYTIFIVIATFIGMCNLVFSLIQRYNRFRLERLLANLKKTHTAICA